MRAARIGYPSFLGLKSRFLKGFLNREMKFSEPRVEMKVLQT